ncbi:E3 Ubiquitin-Protein Ligase Rlim [Manis pentadactyla]|nr:E3 Ubiquitin-Protein Ligase Rlim [Manis pentadactyla]
MENSGPNNEEDSVDQQKTQMGPLVREEDFYEFVSNLSAEDYRLPRDNNLLGSPGESTDEEVPERPQFMKESPPQHSGENKDTESSNVERSDDSVMECLLSPEQTENVGSGPRGNQPWGGVSQIIPTRNRLVPDLQITVTNHINDGRPNGENEYRLLLTRFSQEILENSPWQVENPQPESSFATPSRSEGSTNEGLMQVPPTRGQQRRRIRSRSPDHRRSRARTEGPDLQISVTNHINDGRPNGENEYRLLLTRFSQEILGNSPWQVENPQPASSFATPLRSEGSTNEGLMQVPPTRGQQRRRIRSRSPDHRRTRARTESMSNPHSVRELCGRHHDSVLSQTSEQPLVNESESHQAEEAPRQQTPDFAFPNWGLLDSRAFRAPLSSERANVPLENEGGRLRHLFSHSEQEDARAHVSTIRSPGHRIVNPYLNGAASCANQSRAMTGFSHSRNLTDSASVSEPSVFRSLRVMERPVSPYASERSDHSSSDPEPNIFSSIRVMARPASPYARESSYDSSSDSEPSVYSSVRVMERPVSPYASESSYDSSSDSEPSVSGSVQVMEMPVSPYSGVSCDDSSSDPEPNIFSSIRVMARPASPYARESSYDSSSDSEPSVYSSVQVMERPVSPYASESSNDSSSTSFNSYLRLDFSSTSTVRSSSSSYVSTSDQSPVSSYTSSDASSVMFDSNDESRFSPGSPTEPFEQSRQMSPVVFEDSDSWPSIDLEQFILFDDEESRGLTKAQIDSLPVRSFRKNDTETSCCICITDYKEGTKVRILPCSHSFHTYCIDRWLTEKHTCPLCRSELADADIVEDYGSIHVFAQLYAKTSRMPAAPLSIRVAVEEGNGKWLKQLLAFGRDPKLYLVGWEGMLLVVSICELHKGVFGKGSPYDVKTKEEIRRRRQPIPSLRDVSVNQKMFLELTCLQS